MKYLNILLACAAEPWALQREKFEAVTQFLLFKATGGDLTAEEIQARIDPKQERGIARQEGTVAVLPIFGVMAQRMNMMDEVSGGGGTSTDIATKQLHALLADEGVKAIILDIDSPGGTVFGTQEFGSEIFAARGIKPIIAQVNSTAASAAYWVAAQADEIVVTPGGRAGSIGVYAMHEDISKALEQEGIKPTLISAGKFKVEGNSFEPLSDEARAAIQDRVDRANTSFVKAVARGRGVKVGQVNEQFGQGRMFDAEQLLDRGMADRIGTLHETLERFGVAARPAAMRQKAGGARAEMAETFIEKLSAGVQLTRRELEHGLKGLAGLSNAEAERAVRVCFKAIAQGEPEAVVTEGPALVSALSGLRKAMDAFSLPRI